MSTDRDAQAGRNGAKVVMGREREQARKLNDRGMTLIEVLVAMLMLSVVSLVFLRSFSQTMFYNRNAREKQYALTVAQSMMEGVKAYGMDALDQQFAGAAPFRLYPPATSAAKSGSCAAGSYRIDGIATGDFNFDVTIDVAPAVADASKPRQVTAEKLAFGSDANKYKDGFYIQGDGGIREQDVVYDKVVDALKAISDMHVDEKNALTAATVKWSYVRVEIQSRTLQVEMTPSKVTVKNVYRYAFEITDYPYRKASDAAGTASGSFSSTGGGWVNDSDAGVVCYDNTNTVGPAGAAGGSVQLENLYLYYLPAYNSTQGGLIKCASDNIKIVNNTGRVINVHAVKQRNMDLSSAEIAICEGHYAVTVEQAGNNKINLYHNLKEKLAGSGAATYTCAPSADPDKAIEDKQALWSEDVIDRTLVYNVKVTVAEGGTGRVVYELSGTVNEK